jgi:hypothetical protein
VAVSKRLRYEILRRDNHACRYCGATAPKAALTVDHVVPVTLGGSDEPANLVTACEPCNAGKSSASPDASLVAGVSAEALHWGQAVRDAAEVLLREYRHRHDLHDQFERHWRRWTFGPPHARRTIPLPDGWEKSVDGFLASGLPMEILWECTEKAMAALSVTPENTFRYMCGIAWRKVRELRDVAQAFLIESGDGG